ncbi:hypothetical protein BsWGS_00274 [Bradybaena similaris]
MSESFKHYCYGNVNTAEIVAIDDSAMKAFRLCSRKRDGSLQRHHNMVSVKSSVASSLASKGSKKKDKPSLVHLPPLVDEDGGHEMTAGEDEEHGHESPLTAPIILTVPECEDILKLSIEGVESTLQQKLELTAETNLRDAILLDYYVSAVFWATQQGYTAQKLSDFLSVVHAMIQKVKEEHASVVELIKELQMMTSECDKDCRPIDRTMQHFSKEEMKAVTGYFYSSLFQHLRLYQYVFSRGQTEEMIASELSVELPLPAETPFPPGLDEGMSESIMTECLLLQTPPLEAEDIEASRAPSDIDVPTELVDTFAKLTLKDAKSIINEACATVLSNLQSDFEGKLKTHEATVLGKITKIRGEDSSATRFP